MRINPKSQKGAITLVVLVSMLFLTAFLMSMYIGIANKARTSAETTKQIAEKTINQEINTIPNEKVREIVIERLKQIENGMRDFRF